MVTDFPFTQSVDGSSTNPTSVTWTPSLKSCLSSRTHTWFPNWSQLGSPWSEFILIFTANSQFSEALIGGTSVFTMDTRSDLTLSVICKLSGKLTNEDFPSIVKRWSLGSRGSSGSTPLDLYQEMVSALVLGAIATARK